MKNFIAFDGESIDGIYVLLGDSNGRYIYQKNGLSTLECLEFLVSSPKGVKVFYGMNYDVNLIMRDLPKEDRIRFFKGDEVSYKQFELKFLGKRIFTVKRFGKSQTFYDVLGFWQGSFLKALETMNLDHDELIEWGKKARAKFTHKQIEEIQKYNQRECELLVEMMKRLDEACLKMHINLRSFHGAGALADSFLSKLPFIKKSQDKSNAEGREIFESAFYGGRIELLKIGFIPSVTTYDINSAYPFATSTLPDLSGKWFYSNKDINDEKYTGVWAVEWDIREWQFNDEAMRHVGLFPFRAKDGYISYPAYGRGIYWQHEILTAMKYIKKFGGNLKLGKALYTHYKPTPFKELIPEYYDLRRVYKNVGDGRQLPIKLFLNSCYGKFAQHTGKQRFYIPAWAGYITSKTRSILLDSVIDIPAKDIVGFATDSIILKKRYLDHRVNKDLGGFSKEEYLHGNVFLMAGLACYNYLDKRYERVRGYRFINGDFTWEKCIDQIHTQGEARFSVNMFITHSLADAHPIYEKYRCKVLSEVNEKWPNFKRVNPFGNTKRDYDFLYLKNPEKKRLDEHEYDSRIPNYQRKCYDDSIHASHFNKKWDADKLIDEGTLIEQSL